MTATGTIEPISISSATVRVAPARRGQFWLDVAVVFAVFALHAAWPVPDVNEAHYLTKARHFWQPDFLAGDFFLESAETHQVFYFTVGWLSLVLPPFWFAWCGRIVVWLLASWTWTRLSRSLAPRTGFAPLAAGLFVAMTTHFQMAGEWVIGGLEAKGVAYALLFFAIEAIVRRRWNAAGAADRRGDGVSRVGRRLDGDLRRAYVWWRDKPRRTASAWLPGVVIGGLLATVGLLPALALSWDVAPEVTGEASRIYVYQRLRHHLVPHGFDPAAVVRFVTLAAVWVAAGRLRPQASRRRRLRQLVAASLALAVVGWGISWIVAWDVNLAARLLRFYWFRLADAMLPLGVALEIVWLIAWRWRTQPALERRAVIVAASAVAIYLVSLQVERIVDPRPRADAPGKVADIDDWRRVCQWIHEQTPPDALFLTPRRAQTFKWYAERREVVTWKDTPQDDKGIIEWWRRLVDVHSHQLAGRRQWYETLAEAPPERLRDLATAYDAQYLVTRAEPRLALPLVYQNNSYAVYQFTE